MHNSRIMTVVRSPNSARIHAQMHQSNVHKREFGWNLYGNVLGAATNDSEICFDDICVCVCKSGTHATDRSNHCCHMEINVSCGVRMGLDDGLGGVQLHVVKNCGERGGLFLCNVDGSIVLFYEICE